MHLVMCVPVARGQQSARPSAAPTQVRTLDLAQMRVQDALGKIKAILDHNNCINGVQAAMEAEVGQRDGGTGGRGTDPSRV